MPAEIPKALLPALRLLGPLHEECTRGYWFAIRAVLKGGDEVAGYLIEQRLAETSEAPALGQGLIIRTARGPDSRAEPTWMFVEILAEALACLRQG